MACRSLLRWLGRSLFWVDDDDDVDGDDDDVGDDGDLSQEARRVHPEASSE